MERALVAPWSKSRLPTGRPPSIGRTATQVWITLKPLWGGVRCCLIDFGCVLNEISASLAPLPDAGPPNYFAKVDATRVCPCIPINFKSKAFLI